VSDASLERQGLLLVTDPVLPSVAGIVAREPVRGSWWSHPKSHEIFSLLERLDAGGGVLLVKLVSGKQTFVDKTLWRDFFSVATAKATWQTRGLSPTDRSLLRRVETGDPVRAGSQTRIDAAVRVLAKENSLSGGVHHGMFRAHSMCCGSMETSPTSLERSKLE
jgi:hypothetical protein